MHPWSRSRFLSTAAATGAAAAAGGTSFVAFPHAAGAQAAAAATTIASYVGEKMLAGALGRAGGAVLGKIVASIFGGGPSLSDIAGQLSAISAQLTALQQSVAQLQSSLNIQLAGLSYQVAFGEKTQALIDKNRRLLELYGDLVGPGGLNEPSRSNTLGEIHYILTDIDYSDGVRGWYDKLYGNPEAGTKGIIELWGRAVQARNNNLLNPATAKAAQDHFDYFDGQLALTAMFNVELYEANGQHAAALRVITNWAATRRAMLGIVRGGNRGVDQSYVLNGGDAQLQTIPLAALPLKTIYVPGTKLLYYATVLGPVQLSYMQNGATINSMPWLADQLNRNLARAMQETGLGPQAQWHRVGANEFVALVNALPGGKTGGDDRIVDPMRNAGFEIPPQPGWFLTDIGSDHCYNCDNGNPIDFSRATIAKEGGGWDTGARGPAGGFLPLLAYAAPAGTPFPFIWN